MIALSAGAQNNTNCVLHIDKHPIDSIITAVELEHLATIEVLEPVSGKRLRPSDFQWVISAKGSITKGNISQLYKITDMMPHLKPGAVLFIDQIKFKGYTGICGRQWAFVLR